MLSIFAVMVAAMAIGWTLRQKNIPRQTLARGVSLVIITLMFLIGIESGNSAEVIQSFGQIFLNASVIAIAALIGCCSMAYLVNRYILKVRIKKQPSHTPQKSHSGHIFSFLLVGAFIAGVLCALYQIIPHWVAGYSSWALYLLMALVGFNIGSDVATIKALKNQNWKLIFLPLATIIGSLLGILCISWALSPSITEQLAVGSGMGYYSLSSVLLTELKGAELGAVALAANVIRELITVIFAGFLAHKISPLALISAGGATTMDVTLPVIMRECGGGFLAMAIFHGVVVDLSVPLLVTLFGAL